MIIMTYRLRELFVFKLRFFLRGERKKMDIQVRDESRRRERSITWKITQELSWGKKYEKNKMMKKM